MVSRLILFVHTVVFGGLVVVSLGSPFLKAAYPAEFAHYFLWAVGGLLILILGSWYFYGGDCPLTVWENSARTWEGRPTYRGSCIDRHAKLWFGWTPPASFNTIFPIGVLIVPLVTGFFF